MSNDILPLDEARRRKAATAAPAPEPLDGAIIMPGESIDGANFTPNESVEEKFG